MKFTTDIPPLHRIRMQDMYVSCSRAARIVGKSQRWVRLNRELFIVDDSKRNLKFELSSVLELMFIFQKDPNVLGFKEVLKSKKPKKKRKTYLMTDLLTGMTKIGYSISPRTREKTLQSEKPETKLLAVLNKNIERELHLKYSDYRVRGEWFNISEKQIFDIISNYGFEKLK